MWRRINFWLFFNLTKRLIRWITDLSDLLLLGGPYCLNFYLHTYGSDIGSIYVILRTDNGAEEVKFSSSGPRDDFWWRTYNIALSLDPTTLVRHIFVCVRGIRILFNWFEAKLFLKLRIAQNFATLYHSRIWMLLISRFWKAINWWILILICYRSFTYIDFGYELQIQ